MKLLKILQINKIKVIAICILALTVIGFGIYRNMSTDFSVKCYPDSGKDYVVLLHGIGSVSYTMTPLAKELQDQGFSVININYPSTVYDIETIAETYLDSVITTCCVDPERKIHFVTHSMGGIVTRYYLKHHKEEINLGRVVMLSPPNNGSEVADVLGTNTILQSIFGPALGQLGTDSTGIAHSMGPVDFELGVITGNKTIFFPGSMMIPGADDGFVSIDSAPVDGMRDFEILPISHHFVLSNAKVKKEVVCFLKVGNFNAC